MRPPNLHVPIVVGLLCVAVGPLSGQVATGSLQGRLVIGALQPLSSAEIIAASPALPQPMHSTTDTHGNFRLLAVPAGTYTVRIRAIGYRPVLFERVVVALGNNTTIGTVTMEPVTVQLSELVVTAASRRSTSPRHPAEQASALPSSTSCRSIEASIR